MKVFAGAKLVSAPFRQAAIALGNFDGVHRAHQEILKSAIYEAKKMGGESVVYTFFPHPRVVLQSQTAPQFLCTREQKLRLFSHWGMDAVVEEPFTEEFAQTEPEIFFTEYLQKRLQAKTIFVGYDFAFGKNRSGSLGELDRFCKKAGISLRIIPKQEINGQMISSSRIRDALLYGHLPLANSLLGRFFSYEGQVIHGEQRGRELGYPTANLTVKDQILLPFGIYSTWCHVEDNVLPSVTSIGVRPTFNDPKDMPPVLVETHILGIPFVDLYGRTLTIQFVDKLREEWKFEGVEALKAQMAQDVKDAMKSLQA